MVRLFITFLSLIILCGSAYAGYYENDYYCGVISSKLNPCCQGYGDSEKCKQKQYKKWNKRCRKYNGRNCSYDFWYGNRSWDDDAWYSYWNTDVYKNAQKVNRKVNLFRNVVNSTKELFTW